MIIGAIKLKSTLWSYMSETYLKRGLTSDAIVAAHNAIAADAANQKGLTLFKLKILTIKLDFFIFRPLVFGSGFVCVWRLFGSDCDWHFYDGKFTMFNFYLILTS